MACDLGREMDGRAISSIDSCRCSRCGSPRRCPSPGDVRAFDEMLVLDASPGAPKWGIGGRRLTGAKPMTRPSEEKEAEGLRVKGRDSELKGVREVDLPRVVKVVGFEASCWSRR